MVKKIALLIVICLCLVGCGETATLVPFIQESEDSINFENKTFYIVSDVEPKETIHETFLSYGETTTNYESAIKRFEDVEKLYNCKLEFKAPINSRDMLIAAASQDNIDMVIHPIYYGGFTDIMSGIYTPISEIPAIDYMDSEKWGSPNMLELFCYNNELYGVLPALWPDSNIMSSDFLLVINEDMAKANGMEDPRDLFEQGQWTHDNFLDTVKRFYNNEDPNRIVYGYSGSERHFIDMSLKSFNVDFVVKNDDVYENGYNTKEFITAIEWMAEFTQGEYKGMAIFEGMACVDHWVNNETGIAAVHMNYLCSMGGEDSSSEIIYSDKEYGLVPFPSLDGSTIHAQYERVINGIMFPSWSIYSAEMGIIANAIFEPFEGLETLEAQKANLNSNLFFDERDTNLVFEMTTKAKYLYHDEGIDDYHSKFEKQLGQKAAAQIQQELAGQLDKIIEEFIISGRSSMETIFGK